MMMSQIMMNSMNSQQRLQATTSFENLDNTIRSLMAVGTASTAGTNACLTMFKGKTGTAPTISTASAGTQLTNMYYSDGSNFLTVGTTDPSGLNIITGITLATQSGTTCNANSNCALVVTISGKNKSNNTVSRPIIANFSGSVDGSKVLTGCSYQVTSTIPVGDITIVHSGEEKSFTNNYQSQVTVRTIVQAAGGGGSQGGDDCSGNDPGYVGGNGAYFDGKFQLQPGEKLLVEIGIPGKDGMSIPPEWARDSQILVINGSGQISNQIVVQGGKGNSYFPELNRGAYPLIYLFNETHVQTFYCGTNGGDSNRWSPCKDMGPGPSGDGITPAVSILSSGSELVSSSKQPGTECIPNTPSYPSSDSYYNTLVDFSPPLGKYSKSIFYYGYIANQGTTQNKGFGQGGKGGYSGTDHLQTSGQTGIGLIYLVSSP